jgi:hypothetical protein
MRNCRRFTTLLAFCAFLFAGVVLYAGNNQPTGFKVRGIQVATIQSDEISVPAEFRVALYENLVRQLESRDLSTFIATVTAIPLTFPTSLSFTARCASSSQEVKKLAR